MPSIAWNVYLNSKLINTVFFTSDCDADYVYRALVSHDGYDSRIVVREPLISISNHSFNTVFPAS